MPVVYGRQPMKHPFKGDDWYEYTSRVDERGYAWIGWSCELQRWESALSIPMERCLLRVEEEGAKGDSSWFNYNTVAALEERGLLYHDAYNCREEEEPGLVYLSAPAWQFLRMLRARWEEGHTRPLW